MKTLIERMETEKNDPSELAAEIIDGRVPLTEALQGFFADKAKVKYPIVKAVRQVGEKKPETLYSETDFFVDLLDNDNNVLKWNAMDIIADMVSIDEEGKFEKVFDKYFGLLNEGSLITAGHVVDNAAKIAAAKPDLRSRIEERILTIDDIKLPTDECHEILAGKAIISFNGWFDKAPDVTGIIDFVKKHRNSLRPATKKKAEKFLTLHHL